MSNSVMTQPFPAATRTAKTCPISRDDFAAHAEALAVAIDGHQLSDLIQPKEFGTKSIGWAGKGKKITLEVKGIQVPCWVYLNVTVIGSKELPPMVQTSITNDQPTSSETAKSNTPSFAGNEKKNGHLTREQREKQRFWHRCLRIMARGDRNCGAAVSMYYERFHALPKDLRYIPDLGAAREENYQKVSKIG